jgi:pimeloyl-ACP methyl ester carboxylesterase
MLAEAARAPSDEGVSHTVQSADGLPLHARVWEPVGAATGLPVLCLHGLTRNSRDFELVGPRLAALGRRAIAVDVRGRGRSARAPDPALYTPIVYVQDVLSVLDALDVPKAAFLGTSMGGIMTMVAAATAPARIAAAILNDIGPVIESAGYQRIGSYVGKTMAFDNAAAALDAIKATQSPAFPDRDDAFWRTFARRVTRTLEDGRVVFDYDPAIAAPFEGGAAQAPDLTQLFEALAPFPLLVVRGAISDLLSEEGVELMRLVKPDLREAIVPNVGHAPTLEEEAAWLAIVDFLATVP